MKRVRRSVLRPWIVSAVVGGFELGAAAPPPDTYREKVKLVKDESVAESLERQKNLNFAHVRIDGEKTEHPLSGLTADQILHAEATKVPTPDLDADTIGGLLQLTSRRAFEQKKRTIRATLATSYDPLGGEFAPEATLTFGRSLGPRNLAGFLATLEHRLDRDRDEEIELEWEADAEPRRFSVRDEDGAGTATNFNGTFDWKWSPDNIAFVRAETQLVAERIHSRRLSWDFDRAFATPVGAGPTAGVATLARTIEETRTRDRGWTLAGGANRKWPDGLIEVRFSHRAQLNRVLDQRTYEFVEEDVTVAYRRVEPEFPIVTAPGGGSAGNPQRETLEQLQLQRGSERRTETIGAIDVERAPAGAMLRWKFGGKARLQQTDRAPRYETYDPAGAGLRAAGVPPQRDVGRILQGRYAIDPSPAPGALAALFRAQPERFAFNHDRSRAETDPARFDARQDIFAGYAMAAWTAGAARLLAGARVEHTASRFRGYDVAFDENGRFERSTPVRAQTDATHLFPGVHASQAITKRLRAFASWTLSIRRPEYVAQVPSRRILRAVREIEEGNAALRPALHTNYDAALDFAYHDTGQLSLEGYHREIRDPSFVRRSLLTTGEFADFERTRPENGARARITGLQLAWQQDLEVLSRRFEGLRIEMNLAHERSRQTVDNRPGESLPLAERPALELSVQLAYERGPHSLRLEFGRTGRTLHAVGTHRGEDRYVPAWSNWDLSLSHKVSEALRVFLDAENLTATPDRTYIGAPSRPDFHSLDLREYRFGLRWEL